MEPVSPRIFDGPQNGPITFLTSPAVQIFLGEAFGTVAPSLRVPAGFGEPDLDFCPVWAMVGRRRIACAPAWSTTMGSRRGLGTIGVQILDGGVRILDRGGVRFSHTARLSFARRDRPQPKSARDLCAVARMAWSELDHAGLAEPLDASATVERPMPQPLAIVEYFLVHSPVALSMLFAMKATTATSQGRQRPRSQYRRVCSIALILCSRRTTTAPDRAACGFAGAAA